MAKPMREQDETPELESKSHSRQFLMKAAKLAGKRGKAKKRLNARHGRSR